MTARADMGEIRTKVRLTNAVDEELALEGKLPANDVRSYEVDALVDTGATRSVIPAIVARQLGLSAARRATATFADGRKEQIHLSSAIHFFVLDRDTVDEAIIVGDQVLIGQTVLEKTDLLADCKNQRLIPNPAHPDGPVTRI
jgi:clan AA aspartic protease